jgi:hypothetical protein
MLAGVLHASGWNTGDNYLHSRATNPKGFYEDETVNRVNDTILRTVVADLPRLRGANRLLPLLFPRRRVNTGLWLAIPQRWPRLPSDQAAETIRTLTASRPFAYKDPRFCHTLPAWEPFLPSGTVIVCVFREPSRTANSIAKEMATPRYRRVPIRYRRALKVWESAYRQALSQRDGRWLFVHFDQILDGSAFPRLERALSGPLDRSHIDPALKRSSASGRTPDSVMRVYEDLCALSEEK